MKPTTSTTTANTENQPTKGTIMSTKMETLEPKVWVGCLACYNNGDLRGEWMDAADGPDWKCPVVDENGPHEEFWVMDYEGFGGMLDGECSPTTAAKLAATLDSVPEFERAAFAAWVGEGCGDSDDYLGFADHYRGEWGSFRDYAEDDAALLLEGVDETVARYFDYAAYARDLESDYTVLDAEEGKGKVYVFSQ